MQRLTTTLALLVLTGAPPLAGAQTVNEFNGDGDGSNWHDLNNWNQGHPPTQSEIARIPAHTPPFNVIIDSADGTAWALQIVGGAALGVVGRKLALGDVNDMNAVDCDVDGTIYFVKPDGGATPEIFIEHHVTVAGRGSITARRTDGHGPGLIRGGADDDTVVTIGEANGQPFTVRGSIDISNLTRLTVKDRLRVDHADDVLSVQPRSIDGSGELRVVAGILQFGANTDLALSGPSWIVEGGVFQVLRPVDNTELYGEFDVDISGGTIVFDRLTRSSGALTLSGGLLHVKRNVRFTGVLLSGGRVRLEAGKTADFPG